MLPKIKHQRVNWEDGMMITRRNFIDNENHFYDLIRDGRSMQITEWNYGLLPHSEESPSLQIELFDEHILLHKCRGVSAGGNRIEFNEEVLSIPLKFDLLTLKDRFNLHNAYEEHFFLVVKINPYENVPIGDIREDESQPRQPFALPLTVLEVIRAEELNLHEQFSNVLPISKVTWRSNKFILNERFIPPSTSFKSHPDLIDFYIKQRELLSAIEKSSRRIIKRIKSQKQTSFVANVFLMVTEIGGHITETIDDVQHFYRSSPPIYLLNYYSKLARKFSFCLNRLREEEKILNYISNVTGLSPNGLTDTIDDLNKLEYSHLEIIEMMDKITNFSKMLNALFEKLEDSKLDNERQYAN